VAFGVLRQGGLLEHAYNIKVLGLQENSFAFEVGADEPLLLFYWLRAAVNFLQEYLHEICLAHNQVAELFGHFVGLVFF
jgi:hypothetical protein